MDSVLDIIWATLGDKLKVLELSIYKSLEVIENSNSERAPEIATLLREFIQVNQKQKEYLNKIKDTQEEQEVFRLINIINELSVLIKEGSIDCIQSLHGVKTKDVIEDFN